MSCYIRTLPSSWEKLLMQLQGRLRTEHRPFLLDAPVFLLGGKE
jgi:hypothetical protein